MNELLYNLILNIHTNLPEEELIAELQEAITDRLDNLGADINYVGVTAVT